MSASLLTTKTRFKQYASMTGTSQDALITTLITQVSAGIERYLRRTLTTTTYKVWLDGSGSTLLRVHQWPILAVYQVSISSNSVGYVENTSSAVSRATVSFDGTNLSLSEVSTAGTQTISELPVSTSKVLSTLKTAIEAKSGWSCTINSSEYDGEPTALLKPIYGQDALSPGTAGLYIPDDPDPVKIVNEDMIELSYCEASFRTSPVDSIAPPDVGCGFPPGSANIFIWFKAGYTMPSDADGETPASDGTLPEGLALITHQILQDVLSSTKLNSNLQSESIGGYSYSLRVATNGAVASAIENRKKDLNAYRRVSI